MCSGIWALGDFNGRGAFTHTSYNDFEIVGGQYSGWRPRRVSDRIPAYAVYTDPPLAAWASTETEVRARAERPCSAATHGRVARAKERGETEGFMKVLVDAESKRILGATLIWHRGR